MMEQIIDILSWIALTLGGIFVFIGGLGALRLPNLYTRMHAASLTDTMACILIMVGLMLQGGLSLVTLKLAAILAFLLFTSPTASNALASAAILSGYQPQEGKVTPPEPEK
ncbi:MAG: monovalent cation/H(+) antiporter subunit G [Woeseiaceae bacterium]|nr:monovalent cation/H(+) antiporter subunit G [Woeseiaceae bacterium]